MTSPAKLNEYNHAEEPARVLLERLGWSYVPREALAEERGDEREAVRGPLRGCRGHSLRQTVISRRPHCST